MKKILFVGTYSSLNKGDRLMQEVFAKKLKSQSADIEITLASPFPKVDRKNYESINVVKSYRRNLPLSFFKIILLLLLPLKHRISFAKKDHELKHYINTHIVTDLSGDMLTEDYGIHVAISHSIPLIYSYLLDKPYFIVAQSIGPFKVLKRLYTFLFKNAQTVLPRETISFNYLKKLGLRNLNLVNDLGFLLEPSDNDKCQVSGNYFCVAPSGLILKKFNNKYSKEEIISNLADILDSIIINYNYKIILVPHVMTPSAKLDDDAVCSLIEKKMQNKATVLSRDLSPGEIKTIVKKSQGMIAFRMHAALAAIDCCVPTIAAAYSHKFLGVMKNNDVSDYVVNFDDLFFHNLRNKIEDIINNKSDIEKKLARNRKKIKESSERSIQIILEYLYA